jgi:hypothetical protein
MESGCSSVLRSTRGVVRSQAGGQEPLQEMLRMAVAAPFLLVNPDFSKTEVVKVYAHTMVAEIDNRRKERGAHVLPS